MLIVVSLRLSKYNAAKRPSSVRAFIIQFGFGSVFKIRRCIKHANEMSYNAWNVIEKVKNPPFPNNLELGNSINFDDCEHHQS